MPQQKSKKIQSLLLQDDDLSQSDQQQLVKSIMKIKQQREKKRRLKIASSPFEIDIHSWAYSMWSPEQFLQLFPKVPHTFIKKFKFSHHEKYGGSKHKYLCEAVIRCPNYSSVNSILYYILSLSVGMTSKNFPDDQIRKKHSSESINTNLSNIAKKYYDQLGDTVQSRQRLWQKLGMGRSQIIIRFYDKIIYDNHNPIFIGSMDGQISLMNAFMIDALLEKQNQKIGHLYRTDADGNFVA
jgi:hypothetical protein